MREIRIPGIRRVLRISWSKASVRREVEEEIRFHIDNRVAQLIISGIPERVASEQARAEYGDVEASQHELIRVDHRRIGSQQREEWLMTFLDDLRYSARSLARRPALLVVIVATLSLGIAANAIMFGVVDQLLLRAPAHVLAPEKIRRIYYRDGEEGNFSTTPVTTYPVLTSLRANVPAFEELAAYGYTTDLSLGRGSEAENVKVQLVSGNFFKLLGVKLALGAGFSDADDQGPTGEAVAILSYDAWRQRLGGSAGAIGRQLEIQGKLFTVVGIAPRGFAGIDRQRVDVWVPISSFATELMGPGWYNTTNNWWAQLVGRIRSDAAPELAVEQATAAYRGLLREWKQPFRDSTSSITLSSIIGTRTPSGLSREGKVSLWLMGVSGIVLLIACANVANLLIARTLERRREIAVRMALGVSRRRLFRMLLTETILLATTGAVAALIIAYGASHLVQRILLPEIVWNESVLDGRVFGFTLVVTVTCMLLAGIAPALQGMTTRVNEGLKESSRQVAGGRGRLRFTLLLVQAALSVILLVGAGLTVRSLRNVVTREVGVDQNQVIQVTMPLSQFGFDKSQIEEMHLRAVEKLRLIPGVTNVAVARLTFPMGNASASGFKVPGVKRPKLHGGGPYNSAVTPGFFATIGTRIIAGRDFSELEARVPSRVVIVNEVLAKAYWPDQSALGQCVMYGRDSTCSEVIGVVANVLQFAVINDDRAIVYSPPSHPSNSAALPGAILVRSAGDPDAITPKIQRALQTLAPTMPFVHVKSYRSLLAPQLQPWRLGATMFTLFGVIALLIAAVGLYSVMAYWVSQRRHEIGVRMALGAQRGDVMRLVLLQSSRAVVAGLLLGGIVALIASRWISDMLYETSARDPLVYGLAALVLILASSAASIVPARRSTRIDPAIAIRNE